MRSSKARLLRGKSKQDTVEHCYTSTNIELIIPHTVSTKRTCNLRVRTCTANYWVYNFALQHISTTSNASKQLPLQCWGILFVIITLLLLRKSVEIFVLGSDRWLFRYLCMQSLLDVIDWLFYVFFRCSPQWKKCCNIFGRNINRWNQGE